VLRSFRLGNHRSFRDEQELLLMPAMPGDDRPAVPVAAIYGANASGKSNLLNGLWFLSTAVTDSLHSVLPADFFRLGGGAAEDPSSFVVEIVVDSVRYTYGFVIRASEVEEEWLYSYPAKRKRVVFERKGRDIHFGSAVSGLRAKFSVLEELIRPDVLLLSACSRLNLEPLMPVYRWFERDLVLWSSLDAEDARRLQQRVGAFVRSSPDNARRLLSLLVAADVGITDVVAEEVRDSPSRLHKFSASGEPRWKLSFGWDLFRPSWMSSTKAGFSQSTRSTRACIRC